MSKSVIMDSWLKKFSAPIGKHWEQLGHEVIFNPTREQYAEADLVFFYQSDNQLVTASKEKWLHKGKVYAQCVDIEVWANQPMAVDWTYVDGLFFMSEHIRDYVLERITPPSKLALIKPGINLEEFPLRPPIDLQGTPVRKVAYVVGDRRIWDVKRLDIALMMIRDLLNTTPLIWQLHILGSYSSHVQYNDYCEHLIKNLDLKGFIFWYERQESVSKWFDDKDFFLLPSTKEAFSYATAEAMAKGIKPVIGNWRGADINWAPFYCKTYKQMFETFVHSYYAPDVYRDFIATHYDEKRYMQEINAFMEIK